MARISHGILVLMQTLGHDFSGHYHRLDVIPLDIISGVYCIRLKQQRSSTSDESCCCGYKVQFYKVLLKIFIKNLKAWPRIEPIEPML